MTWYHTEHRHSGIRFLTPLPRHSGQGVALLTARKRVYEAAKIARPERWRGRAARNWQPIGSVWLNPDHPALAAAESLSSAA